MCLCYGQLCVVVLVWYMWELCWVYVMWDYLQVLWVYVWVMLVDEVVDVLGNVDYLFVVGYYCVVVVW